MISLKRLKKALHYDPETGVFTHLVFRGTRAKPGGVAGGSNGRGYRQVFIEGRTYSEHRWAWFYVTGYWPKDEIDHINTNKIDNRWLNLREADRQQNRANSKAPFTNTSGRKGVTWHKAANKWQAQITVKGKPMYLGLFNSVGAAGTAYENAANEHFGKFARIR